MNVNKVLAEYIWHIKRPMCEDQQGSNRNQYDILGRRPVHFAMDKDAQIENPNVKISCKGSAKLAGE
jgi:hypothetical protein